MIKSIDFIDESIFNYLCEDDYAVFIGLTGLCDQIRLSEGVVWVQYNENGEITAVIATGENEKRVVFADANADKDELEFIIGKYGDIKEGLSESTDKKYLLCKSVSCKNIEKGTEKSFYVRIKNLNKVECEKNNEIIAFKMLLNDMGKCEGALITEQGEEIGGGFITFCHNISLITDVFICERYRDKGYGKRVVEKLLKCSPNEKVYLVSKEYNLDFYKKCGFEIVKEIHNYKG